jgi:hypothetical protein
MLLLDFGTETQNEVSCDALIKKFREEILDKYVTYEYLSYYCNLMQISSTSVIIAYDVSTRYYDELGEISVVTSYLTIAPNDPPTKQELYGLLVDNLKTSFDFSADMEIKTITPLNMIVEIEFDKSNLLQCQ